MEEEECDIVAIDSNISCKLCGEKQFDLLEGFYYCQECGTKQDQVRLVEVEHEEEFADIKQAKRQKVQSTKAEKPRLTSWECYNFILRGLVEELLALGAKEELKLMALQVWAAYLRRMEVAFFNKRCADLPRLSVRYLKNDAETLYNHGQNIEKRKRKRKRCEDSVGASGDEELNNKKWRKSKRKLDESVYSAVSSQNTSTSGTTVHAIKLNFTSRARKYWKKKMPIKHLAKHELDAERLLTCHKKPKVRELNRMEHAVTTMNMKQVYSILAIALNLIEDDIQLSDLVRFIQEGSIGSGNVLQYFPENFAPHGKETLKRINFYAYPDKFPDKALRDHIGLLCKNIGIRKFKMPDLKKLVQRYVTDLCLPSEVALYIERLINLLPPIFQTRAVSTYPGYEARAMAYVIFVLKLLFGLDGHKEKLISMSAKAINRKIRHFNRKRSENESLLFVWSDWVEYVEMRKVVVSHYNLNFCRQFKQCQSTGQLIEHLSEEIRQRDEQDSIANNDGNGHETLKFRVENMKNIFETFQQEYNKSSSGSSGNAKTDSISFKANLRPASCYFKQILLHHELMKSSSNGGLRIPDFMRIDHAQRNIKPFVEVKPLIKYFSDRNCTLHVTLAPCTSSRNYVGVFRVPASLSRGSDPNVMSGQKADFDISKEKWMRSVAEVVAPTDDLEFKRDLDSYEKNYMKKLRAELNKRKQHTDNIFVKSTNNLKEMSTHCPIPSSEHIAENRTDMMASLCSFDVFSELNMDPLRGVDLSEPRRNLAAVDLFEGLSDDEVEFNKGIDELAINDTQSTIGSTDNSMETQYQIYTDTVKGADTDTNDLSFIISKMECWMLLGNVLMLKEIQKKQLQDKFPRSFFWLLETCAQTIGVEWSVVYEHLLTVELMFAHGIEKLDDFKDCVHLKYNNPIKDFNMLVNAYREIW